MAEGEIGTAEPLATVMRRGIPMSPDDFVSVVEESYGVPVTFDYSGGRCHYCNESLPTKEAVEEHFPCDGGTDA